MPFAFLIIGILLIVVGFQDTYKQFGAQVEKDVPSFIWFFVAIGLVGAIGYVDELKSFSRALLALILVSLFLGAVNKGGFFNNFVTGVQSGTTAPVNNIGAPLSSSSSGVSSGGSGGGGSGGLGSIVDAGSAIASFF